MMGICELNYAAATHQFGLSGGSLGLSEPNSIVFLKPPLKHLGIEAQGSNHYLLMMYISKG